MEKLKLKKYKKGDKLVGTYLGEIAGDDLQIGSAYSIHADIFDKGKFYQVPNVWSENKGSGYFLDFLIALKRGLDKPVYFCTITNIGLYKYLHRADVGVVEYKKKKPQSLKELGVPIEVYLASEIAPEVIAQTQINHPKTIQLGDVSTIRKYTLERYGHDDIDLLIGGSPCQDLSQAKGKTREGLKGSRSALFWEYLRILKDVRPKYFILENVASMSDTDRDIITEELGVAPIMIDSALVSAQQRKRYFWVGILDSGIYKGFEMAQPEDRGIVIKDILIPNIERKYIEVENPVKTARGIKWDKSGKGYFSQQDRAYSIHGKFPTIPTARTITKANILFDDGRVGVLDYQELEALQGLPHGYTKDISQKEKRGGAIGNAFHVEVIKHILKSIV